MEGRSAKYVFLRILCLVALAVAQEHKYTTKYDNVDIEAVIKNERLLFSYVGCLLDERPCSPDAAELKANLPDALETNCSRCSEAQKMISDRLSHHLIDERPQDWSLLEAKYDPSGAYRERYLHNRDTHAEDESGFGLASKAREPEEASDTEDKSNSSSSGGGKDD